MATYVPDATLGLIKPALCLEIPLAAALQAAFLPVAIINPRQVRDFARSTGVLATTDASDARILALLR